MKTSKTIQIGLTTALVICVLFAGIFILTAKGNKRIIYSHRNEYHEMIQHLFDNEIVENQKAGEIIKEYPPTKVSPHDNYITLQYYKTNEELDDCCISYSYYIHIIVKDNRLVKAFATEGLFAEIDYVFFDILNDSSEDQYWESRMRDTVANSNF